MRRWVFNILCAVSFLLTPTLIALILHTSWQRYYEGSYVTYVNQPGYPHNGVASVFLMQGKLYVVRHYDDQRWYFNSRRHDEPRGWRWLSAPPSLYPPGTS